MTSEGKARPGLAPGARRHAGTRFAALYGELVPHPWRDPDTDRDAYLLFHQRSLAMGLAGLWSMNDAGQDHPLAAPEASLVAPQLRERMGRLGQDVFGCESHSLADHDPLTRQPPFDDSFWNGPSRHRATFHGALAEWSLDALGWLGGFLGSGRSS